MLSGHAAYSYARQYRESNERAQKKVTTTKASSLEDYRGNYRHYEQKEKS
jgi:phosphodiesterase/alkaline phosphatase D-like protein